jgi:hypothetical protein
MQKTAAKEVELMQRVAIPIFRHKVPYRQEEGGLLGHHCHLSLRSSLQEHRSSKVRWVSSPPISKSIRRYGKRSR